GFAADFYREVAEYVDPDARALVLDVLEDTGHAQFAVDHVRAAIAADAAVAGRLALWARRLVGEALVQAQRVAVDRDALARLLVGGSVDLAAVGQLLAWPIRPPTTAPTMPSRMVMPMPIGLRPGTTSRARAPTIKPTITNVTIRASTGTSDFVGRLVAPSSKVCPLGFLEHLARRRQSR